MSVFLHLDKLRTGTHRHIFRPEMMIAGNQGINNIYASGHNPEDKRILDKVLDGLRRQVANKVVLREFIK